MVDDMTQTDAPAEHRFLRLTEEEAEMLLSRSWRPNVELCTRGRILRIIAKKVRDMPPLRGTVIAPEVAAGGLPGRISALDSKASGLGLRGPSRRPGGRRERALPPS